MIQVIFEIIGSTGGRALAVYPKVTPRGTSESPKPTQKVELYIFLKVLHMCKFYARKNFFRFNPFLRSKFKTFFEFVFPILESKKSADLENFLKIRIFRLTRERSQVLLSFFNKIVVIF